MAISKKNYRVTTYRGTQATPIPYWAYGGVDRFTQVPTGENSSMVPAVVVKLLGYTSKAARAQAKELNLASDHEYEFLINNWVEKVETIRPATVEEKKARFPTVELTDEQWAERPYDIVESVEEIIHNDYDTFIQAFGSEDEAATVYEIMKTHQFSKEFFTGATNA